MPTTSCPVPSNELSLIFTLPTLQFLLGRSIEPVRSTSTMSFLGLEGLHVFITGAAGGIGGQAVKEFLGM